MKEISPIVRSLLKQRGIETTEEMEEFLSPSPKRTYDPFLMKNMREGVDLLLKSIEEGKKICIYGDYDADGITSVAIMMQVLSQLTPSIIYYIPSRFDEGYGLNMEAIDSIRQQQVELILTVDCGSVSYKEVEYARQCGMEVIVTDHHNIDDVRADCILINPKQEDCAYPFKGLAGCGVVFKFICALQQTAGLDRKIIREILDLVAIGTVGDIVPLVDENRTLVKYGLKALRSSERIGLRKLFEGLGIEQKTVTEENLAYMVVPHLNAAGRMKDADLGAEILLSESAAGAEAGVQELISRNMDRRRFQDDAYRRCVDIVENSLKDKKFLMIRCEDAHEGITGIVAGKLKEKYNKPVAIVTPAGDYLKGTGRSIPKIDLYNVLKQQQDCFEKFGGHAGACGFTLREKNFAQVADALDATVSEMLADDPELLEMEEKTDMKLQVSDISLETYRGIELLAPFGQSNEKPVFEVHADRIGDIFYMGNESQHARFNAYDRSGRKVKCVLFNKAGTFRDKLVNNAEVVLQGTMDKQIWKETTTIQMIVNRII